MPEPISPFENPKPNLVVVRAGAKSLHPGWLDAPYAQRSWDLVVSYFDEEAYKAHTPQEGVRAVFVKGGKWDGLYKTFAQITDHGSYAHIWLPDDDIATKGAQINGLFEMAKTYDLKICQPTLTLDSYFTHFLLLECAGFRLRYSNYIEIMIPCLSADMFAQVLPYFEQTMSGFGLDYVWCRLPGMGRFKAALLDEIAMRHTRPIGSQLKGAVAKDKGSSSKAEGLQMLADFGNPGKVTPLAYAGILKDGSKIEGRLRMAWKMRDGYQGQLERCLEPDKAKGKLRQIMKRQLIKRIALTPIRL